jgi:hypothetical protein
MKINIHPRGILCFLVLVLTACQLSGKGPDPTVTSSPTVEETPVSTPTRANPTLTSAPTPTETEIEAKVGEIAYAYMEAISEGIGPRPAGSEAESQTAQYLILEFERLGYLSELHPFTVTVEGMTINSANVIAIKRGVSAPQGTRDTLYHPLHPVWRGRDWAAGIAVPCQHDDPGGDPKHDCYDQPG